MGPNMAQDEPAVSTDIPSTCCPICSGPICEARGLCRCLRCQFMFCEGCEGEAVEIEQPRFSDRR
jgi:hypothetical protein